MVVSRNLLKSWLETGDKPTGEQFSNLVDSFFHKTEDVVLQKVNVPATPTSTGVAGQLAADTDFLYVCIATNTWLRCRLSTWE